MAVDKTRFGNTPGEFETPDLSSEFTLESILAEYKGSAYIDGDKKTPSHILNEQAERIILEVSGRSGVAELDSEGASPATASEDVAAADFSDPFVAFAAPEDASAPKSPPAPKQRDGTEDVIHFDNYRYASEQDTSEISRAVEEAIREEEEAARAARKAAGRFFGLFNRGRGRAVDTLEDEPVLEPETFEMEAEIPEPPLDQEMRRYAAACNAVSPRFLGAFLVSALMLILTFGFRADGEGLFSFGGNALLVTGILMIMQLVVMILGIGLLYRGISDFYRRGPNAESLVALSCLLTLISGFYTLITRNTELGLPYCAVSAVSLTCALWGEKLHLRGLTETLKTALAAKEPVGVAAEYQEEIDRVILTKASGAIDGFYTNLVYEDVSERAYRLASPILIVAVFVLSVFTAITTGRYDAIPHMLAGAAAAAAAFSALLSFALPFSMIARSARKSGAAIAGWGGVDDMVSANGVSITDDDLFPTGTLSISGIKIFEEVLPEKALRYTASIIIASGSGLARVFSDLLKKQGMVLVKVDDFACYEGGVGGLIRGERVMTGSAAFMNLMGIRIPADMNMKNAVFTAVNDKLIAMVAINYVPVNSVQNALVSIIREKVKIFFSVRDFNITPLMLEQKFKVSLENVEYITAQNAYDIAREKPSRAAAVLSREGLGPMGEALLGSRLLRRVATVMTVLSIASAAVGLLVMALVFATQAFESARAANLLIYMLCMLLVKLLISGFARMGR